ncbi:hypothetical protein COI71_31810, partial [Bacillus cereus]
SEELLAIERNTKSTTYKEYQKEYQKEFDNLLISYSTYQQERSNSLLKSLFPMIGVNAKLSQVKARQWAKDRRICSPEYFEKYFIYSVRPGQLSDIEFN